MFLTRSVRDHYVILSPLASHNDRYSCAIKCLPRPQSITPIPIPFTNLDLNSPQPFSQRKSTVAIKQSDSLDSDDPILAW
jgi:hypothetical protein